MARVTGPFKFSGSIGGITFTAGEDGQTYAKEKGGPRKRRLQVGEEFANTRRNNAEFKTAGVATRTFRLALDHLMDGVVDRHLAGRITAWLLKGVKADQVNRWGERNLALCPPEELAGFEFNRKQHLEDLVPMNVAHHITTEDHAVRIALPGFRLRRSSQKIPATATHFRVVSALLPIDFAKNTYSQVLTAGEFTAIGRKSGQDFVAAHALDPKPGEWVFWLMGLEFYQQKDDRLLPVRGGALRCMQVWRG